MEIKKFTAFAEYSELKALTVIGPIEIPVEGLKAQMRYTKQHPFGELLVLDPASKKYCRTDRYGIILKPRQ